jgi:hypothetical protein
MKVPALAALDLMLLVQQAFLGSADCCPADSRLVSVAFATMIGSVGGCLQCIYQRRLLGPEPL